MARRRRNQVDNEIDDDERPLKKSKQQQKREAEAAQSLGRALVELSTTHFDKLIRELDLGEDLREALKLCRTIKSHEAHRRQLQYIGKLMRGIDLIPIEQALAAIQRGGQLASARQHELEHWRDQLLHEGESALTELLNRFPNADAVQLRKLITVAHKETAEKQPPRAARQLFRYLRDMLAK